ncbi:MAG: DUF2062 domain-containing protein [Acidobacteriota bacterium]
MRWNSDAAEQSVAAWLRQGITPGRLAITLALGFAIGCVPVVGAPTLLCAGLAICLRLNLPAIQAANYAAMPFQLALIFPFMRLGGHLYSPSHPLGAGPMHLSLALLHVPPEQIAQQFAGFAGQAMVGWLLFALPAVPLLSAALVVMLRRVPALARE